MAGPTKVTPDGPAHAVPEPAWPEPAERRDTRSAYVARLSASARLWQESLPGFTEDACEYIDRPCSGKEGAWVFLTLTAVPWLFMTVCWIPGGHVEDTPFIVEGIVLLIALGSMIAFIPSFMTSFWGPGLCRERAAYALVPVVSCTYLVFFCLIPKYAIGVFPVPLGGVTYTVVLVPVVVLFLVLSLTPEARADPQKRRIILKSFQILLLSITLLAVALPMSQFTMAFLGSNDAAQMLLLAMPYVLRKVFELICSGLLRDQRPDIYPFCRFMAMGFYEGFMGVMMMNAASFKWFAVPLLLAFDVFENFCHLLLIWLISIPLDPAPVSSWHWRSVMIDCSNDTGAGGTVGDTVPLETSASGSDRRRLLVASVLIKEAMEVLVPLQVMASFWGIYLFNPRWNHITAGMSLQDFQYGCLVAGVDLVVESLLFLSLLLTIKYQCRLNPLRLLVRVLKRDLRTYTLTLTSIVMYSSYLQNVSAGTDYTLQFNWMKYNSTWHGGLCWTVGDETPQEMCGAHWPD